MVLVLATVLCAVLVGYIRGGRLTYLGYVQLRHGWLVFISVLAQAALAAVSALDGPAATVAAPLLLTSHLALLAFVICNRLLPGMLLVFAGFAMNASVITANGAMPVARHALLTVSGGEATTITPGKHRLLADGDLLAPLADIFAIPVLRTVVSAGDIVLAAGVGILVVNLMTVRARSRAAHQHDGERSAAHPQDGERSAAHPQDGERSAAHPQDGERSAAHPQDGERSAAHPGDGGAQALP